MEQISKGTLHPCVKIGPQCGSLIKSSRLALASTSMKNISWWDNMIKEEMSHIKLNKLTYKELVQKRRQEKKKFQQSRTCLRGQSDNSKMSKLGTFSRERLHNADLVQTLKTFVKKPKDKARVWRRDDKSIHFNPSNKYEKIGQEMRRDFYDYYRKNIDDDEEKKIHELVTQLVSIDLDLLPLLKAIKVSSKFLRCAPDLKHRKLRSLKAMQTDIITRLIHKDLKALKNKKRAVAFGTTVKRRGSEPSKYDFRTKYLNITHTHPELETFEAVWENILELETTKKFCGWLQVNRHIEPPEYLVEKGTLERISISEKSYDLMYFKNLDGYYDMKDSFEFYEMFSKGALSNTTSDSYSTISSSLVSLNGTNVAI